MASLNKHLREGGSHGQLPFHPDCAVCARERLSGTLAGDALLGTRTQAGLLAATLAVSGLAAPGAALAGGEPIPAQAPRDGELDNGLAEPDAVPDSEDAEPIGDNLLAPDPDDGPDAPEATPWPEPATPVEELEAEPAEPEVIPVAPPPPPVAVPPVEAPPTPAAPPVPKAKPSVLVDPGGSARARVQRLRLEVTEVKNPPTVRPSPAPPVVEPTVTPVADTATASPAQTDSVAGKRIARGTYKVQRGDSLWSIAQGRLAGQATTGQVAREVHRLWNLNKDRIATGDPDLLVVGTVLRLP